MTNVGESTESRESFEERLERERRHAARILETDEENWGWSSAAGRIRKARREQFLSGGGSPDLDVLEIGCGSGSFTAAIARAYPRLIATDVADLLVAAARERLPDTEFRVMDAHHLDFPDGTFDRVVGCSVLHHLDWARALVEVLRVLKPGGQVRFSEPNLMNPQVFLQKSWPWLKERMGDSPDEYAFTKSRIERDLRAAGFVNIRVEPYEFLHPAVPPAAIDLVTRVEQWLEHTPAVAIGGSLRISAEKRAP
jgi:ubiquinone/menaquinone biosynthesis C-methylase UbiE